MIDSASWPLKSSGSLFPMTHHFLPTSAAHLASVKDPLPDNHSLSFQLFYPVVPPKELLGLPKQQPNCFLLSTFFWCLSAPSNPTQIPWPPLSCLPPFTDLAKLKLDLSPASHLISTCTHAAQHHQDEFTTNQTSFSLNS